jgi:hypothetical protein
VKKEKQRIRDEEKRGQERVQRQRVSESEKRVKEKEAKYTGTFFLGYGSLTNVRSTYI